MAHSDKYVEHGELPPTDQTQMVQACAEMLGQLAQGHISGAISVREDPTLYSGFFGVALALWKTHRALHAAESSEMRGLAATALSLLQSMMKQSKDSSRTSSWRPSFLDGESGYHCARAILLREKPSACMAHTGLLLTMSPCFLPGGGAAFEILYGSSGFLHGLLLLGKVLGTERVPPILLWELVDHIATAGQCYGCTDAHTGAAVLMYEWHGTKYLGAAHGVVGIVAQLLLAIEVLRENAPAEATPDRIAEIVQLLENTIEYLLCARFPSGNLPSSEGRQSDKLVQWCHGCAGLIPMLCIAARVLGNQRYIASAIESADTLYARGLLTKGTGLCHGISGNGYAFLSLYRSTGDDIWLAKALGFARFAHEHPELRSQPDNPLSLFEGLAGELCFTVDCMAPSSAWFPCYELP